MARYTLRAARIDSELDVERLKRLQLEVFPSDLCIDPEGTDHDTLWWLVLDGRRAVAFAALTVTKPLDELTADLIRCGVVEGYRGLGFQRRLISARIKKAWELGLTRINTYTSDRNHVSMSNLVGCGFVVDDSPPEDGFITWTLTQ
ncbi:MAG: GNAT family N-acetyltransferase [Proteobacteria bacterium]|nr:GNAT family N-acetyltransferase [Pseudomonadota bacterium]